MATRPEHEEGYYSLKSRFKRARQSFQYSSVAAYKDAYLGMFSKKDCSEADIYKKTLGFYGAVFSLPLIVLGGAIGGDREVEIVAPPVADEAAQFDHGLNNNGHVLISYDGGETGYALFKYDDDYRLYSLDDERLTYIDDADDAWHQARLIQDDYTNLLDVVVDGATLEAQNLEVFSLSDVSKYVQNDDGNLVRYFGELQEFKDGNMSRQSHYNSMQTIWHDASAYFQDGASSIDQAEIEIRAGQYTTDVEIVNDPFVQFLMGVFGTIFIFGNAALAVGCVGPARRKYELKQQQKKLNR
jgi:hypothetical protein